MGIGQVHDDPFTYTGISYPILPHNTADGEPLDGAPLTAPGGVRFPFFAGEWVAVGHIQGISHFQPIHIGRIGENGHLPVAQGVGSFDHFNETNIVHRRIEG